MRQRKIILWALAGLGGVLLSGLLMISLPDLHSSARKPSSPYTVRFAPGLILSDVVKTHRSYFSQPTAVRVTIARRDRRFSSRCKYALYLAMNFLWERTGERADSLLLAAISLYPPTQELVCANPFTNALELYPDDDILIDCQDGRQTVLNVLP